MFLLLCVVVLLCTALTDCDAVLSDCSWSWALRSHGILSLVAVATCPVPAVALGTVLPQTPTQYLEYVTVTCDLLGVNPKQLQSRCMWDEARLSYAVDTTLLRCDIAGTTHTCLWLDFFPWGWGVNWLYYEFDEHRWNENKEVKRWCFWLHQGKPAPGSVAQHAIPLIHGKLSAWAWLPVETG